MHALPGVPGGGGLVTDAGATRRTIGARSPEQACRSPFSGRLQISFLLSVEMERPPGIEPGSSAWKADARPIGQGRMCKSPLRTYGRCHRGNAVRFATSTEAAHGREPARSDCSAHPDWLKAETEKPARREPCGLWTCLSISCSPKPLRAVIGVLDSDAGMQTFSCEPAVAILTTVFRRSMGRTCFCADPASSVLHAAIHVPHRLRSNSTLGSGQHA